MSTRILDSKTDQPRSETMPSARLKDAPVRRSNGPRSGSPLLSTEHLEAQVRDTAMHLSQIRHIQRAFQEQYALMVRRFGEMTSTAEEMESDWANAWGLVCLRLLEGNDLTFTELESRAYPLLESVWLEKIKQLKAYFLWRQGGSDDTAANYSRASAVLRQLLLDREQASVHDFDPVKRYLEEQFLKHGNPAMLDERKPATERLIRGKARRIFEMTGDSDESTNWFRARLYTSMFYENIIGAVLDNNEQKIRTILKAFEFSKASENRYLITNAFEALLALTFLDKKAVRRVLEHPEWFDFSMVSISDWPSSIKLPAGLRYREDTKQLVLDGLISETEMNTVLESLTDERQRDALKQLWHQSQLRPFDQQIL